MHKLTLQEKQQVALGIMDEIDRVCREHNIAYSLAYGSLLGAARHKGFIPWDDDMDIMMMREDYETFAAHFDEWTRGTRYRTSWYRKGDTSYPHLKVVDTHTVAHERYVKKDRSTNVWVDVFPMEEEPVRPNLVYRTILVPDNIRGIAISDLNFATSPINHAIKRVAYPFAKRVDLYRYAEFTDRFARDCKKVKNPTRVVHLIGATAVRMHPKTIFTPMDMDYEGRRYLGIEGFDAYLTVEFGDWRTPVKESGGQMHTSDAYLLDESEIAHEK